MKKHISKKHNLKSSRTFQKKILKRNDKLIPPSKNLPAEKIQKILANAGLGSRRHIESLIVEKRIKINGKIAELGDRMTLHDKVSINNRVMTLREPDERRMLIFNKPEGLVCTRSDPEKRRTVFHELPKLVRGRWVMVGRLDINSQGLLIFTNDGALANRLMHPSSNIEREYAVRILGKVDDAMLERLKNGVRFPDGMMNFDEIIRKPASGANKWFHVILKEGKNREVRRLWESQGVKVSRLIRVRFGAMELPKNLPRGRVRELSSEEINSYISQMFSSEIFQ